MTHGAVSPAAPGCPLCGAGAAILHAGLQDRICGVPGTFAIRHCGACALAFLDGEPAPGAHGNGYYTRQPDPGLLRRVAAVPASAQAVLHRHLGYAPVAGSLAAGWLAQLPPWRVRCEAFAMYLPARPGGRLLDVGCGNGILAARMQHLGWQVTGVEPDPEAAAVARATFGLTVHCGDLHQAGLPARSFDAITMGHVIEHVPDPVGTLREAARLLRPGGTVALVTPNLASLGARVFGRDWMHWDVPRHRHIFSPASLAEVARRGGLVPTRSHTTARGARWSWQRSRDLRRDRPIVESGEARARGPGAIMFELLETAVLPWSDAGEECVLLARVEEE